MLRLLDNGIYRALSYGFDEHLFRIDIELPSTGTGNLLIMEIALPID